MAKPNFLAINNGPDIEYTLDMELDKRGVMWISSSNGIFIYDGYRYKQMDYLDSQGEVFPNEYVKAISKGNDNDLWLGTLTRGLVHVDVDKQSYRFISHKPEKPNGLSSNRVNDILKHDNKGLWIGTKEGLNYYDFKREEFKHYSLADSDSNHIGHLARLGADKILLSTSNGLHTFDTKEQTFQKVFSQGDKLKGKRIRVAVPDEEGKIWIGTFYSGAYLLHPNGNLQALGNYERVVSLAKVGNEIWLATSTNGIAVFDKSSGDFKVEYQADRYSPTGIDSNYISHLYVDNSNTVWIGSWGSKIWLSPPSRNFSRAIAYSPSSKATHTTQDISGTIVFDNGDFWLSRRSEGIEVFNYETGYKYSIQQGDDRLPLASNKIHRILKDNSNNIWIDNLDKGLYRFSPKTNQPTKTPNWSAQQCRLQDKPEQDIYLNAMFQLPSGNMLFLAQSGLYILNDPNNKNCTLQRIESYQSYMPASAVVIDEQCSLIVEYSGFHLFDNERNISSKLKVISKGISQRNLPNFTGGNIMANGDIYLSSNQHIFKVNSLDTEKIEIELLYDMGKQPWIYHLDRFGNLWGNSVYKPAKSEAIKPLGMADGFIPGMERSIALAEISPDTLLMSFRQGLKLIKTANFKPWTNEPAMIISQTSVDGTVTKDPGHDLTLQAEQRDFSIEFAALAYLGPKLIQYRYWLEGYSDTWTYVNANERKANFTNLPPGDYVFRLQSSNRVGDWSRKELNYNIKVLPAWYQTKLFYTLVAIGLILLAYLIHIWRSRIYRKRQSILKSLVKERTKKLESSLNELKEAQGKLILAEKQASLGRLVNGMAHELNTPLGVATMAQSIIIKNSEELFNAFGINEIDDPQVSGRVKKIEESQNLLNGNLARLNNLVGSFKEVSKDKEDFTACQFNILDIADSVVSKHQDKINEKQIAISLLPRNEVFIHSFPDLIHQIFDELISNTLDHAFSATDSEQNRTISIKILGESCDEPQESSWFKILVEDNGSGVDESLADKIFDPFIAKEPSHTGLGLHILANRVAQFLEGSISFTQVSSGGSLFTVTLKETGNRESKKRLRKNGVK